MKALSKLVLIALLLGCSLPVAAADDAAPGRGASAASPEAALPATTPLLEAILRAAGNTGGATACAAQAQIGIPEPREASFCTVSRDCGNGCILQCSGTNCSSTPSSVTCDGSTFSCPWGCTPPDGCSDPCQFCYCKQLGNLTPYCARNFCQ
jgi:hypothetical protein